MLQDETQTEIRKASQKDRKENKEKMENRTKRKNLRKEKMEEEIAQKERQAKDVEGTGKTQLSNLQLQFQLQHQLVHQHPPVQLLHLHQQTAPPSTLPTLSTRELPIG